MNFSPLTTSTTSYGSNPAKCNTRRSKVNLFIVHHAASTSLSAVRNIFAANGGRGTSAQYIVCDEHIIGAVPEKYRAWTSGGKRDGAIVDGSVYDHRAITVETINSTSAPHWYISKASFESLARLIEDCSYRHGFPLQRATAGDPRGITSHGDLLKVFRASYATACPGGINVNGLIERAKQIRAARKSSTPPALVPEKPVKSAEQIEEEELMSAAESIIKTLTKEIHDQARLIESRVRREVRPEVYFVDTGADGTKYTIDTSPYVAIIQPASGFILPLETPATGQLGSLKARYRIIGADSNPVGFAESVFLNQIKDIALGTGALPLSTTDEEGVAWAMGLFA